MKEYREIRKQLSGPEASPYMGYARKVLGEMKNVMGLGGLQQLRWVKDLKDGTRIVVTSVFGQDKVKVLVPVKAIKDKGVEMIRVKVQALVVVGNAFVKGPTYDVRRAWVWTGPGSIVNMGTLGDASSHSEAWGVSGDGSVVVGYATQTEFSGSRAFRWTTASGMEAIAGATSYAWGVSGDGSVIVGDIYPVVSSKAFRWTAKTGVEYIMANESFARGVSEDGDVVVGFMQVSGDTRAFRWTHDTGAEDILGTISAAYGVSADGLVVVGAMGNTPFKWSVAGGLESLDMMGGSTGVAYGVSEDGSVVVGIVTISGQTRAVKWTLKGVERIATIGERTNSATAVSYDGDAVVGRIAIPGGGGVAYVVEGKGAPVLIETLGSTFSGFFSATAFGVATPATYFKNHRVVSKLKHDTATRKVDE